MGAEIDLFRLVGAVIEEDKCGANPGASAQRFGHRIRMVLAIEHDPHIDPISPHRGQKCSVELFAHDGGLELEALLAAWYAVAVLRDLLIRAFLSPYRKGESCGGRAQCRGHS